MIRRSGQNGRLECSEDCPAQRSARPIGGQWGGAGVTISMFGWKCVRSGRHSDLHGQLEGSEEGPA